MTDRTKSTPDMRAIVALMLYACAMVAQALSLSVTWTHELGTAITYNVYDGDTKLNVAPIPVLEFVYPVPLTWYGTTRSITVTALANGLESARSTKSSITIPLAKPTSVKNVLAP